MGINSLEAEKWRASLETTRVGTNEDQDGTVTFKLHTFSMRNIAQFRVK